MKHSVQFIFLLCTGLFLASCGDKANPLSSITPATGARVKFYHASPDAAGIDIYVNDKKFSGVNTVPPAVPVPLTYFNSFPNQDYALLTPGAAAVKLVVPASTSAITDATLLTTNLTAEDKKYYSVFLYGTSPNYSTLTLTDDLTATDATKAYVRLVNLVSGTDAAATYDLVVNGVVVSTGIAPLKGQATFVPIPAITYAAAAVPVQIRPTSSTVVTATATPTIQPYAGRFYTFVSRGVVGGTGTKIITLSSSVNR